MIILLENIKKYVIKIQMIEIISRLSLYSLTFVLFYHRNF